MLNPNSDKNTKKFFWTDFLFFNRNMYLWQKLGQKFVSAAVSVPLEIGVSVILDSRDYHFVEPWQRNRFSLNRPHMADLVIELPCPLVFVWSVFAIGCSFFQGPSPPKKSYPPSHPPPKINKFNSLHPPPPLHKKSICGIFQICVTKRISCPGNILMQRAIFDWTPLILSYMAYIQVWLQNLLDIGCTPLTRHWLTRTVLKIGWNWTGKTHCNRPLGYLFHPLSTL